MSYDHLDDVVDVSGSGLPEYRKEWLEKFSEIQEAYDPTEEPGVFKVAHIDRRTEPDYQVRKFGKEIRKGDKIEKLPPDPDAIKEIYALTFVLHDVEGKNPVVDKESGLPLAVEHKINVPTMRGSFENFEKSGLYTLVRKAGFIIKAEDLQVEGPDGKPQMRRPIGALDGLYFSFEVKIQEKEMRKGGVRKFANIEGGTKSIQKPSSKALNEANKAKLAAYFENLK